MGSNSDVAVSFRSSSHFQWMHVIFANSFLLSSFPQVFSYRIRWRGISFDARLNNFVITATYFSDWSCESRKALHKRKSTSGWKYVQCTRSTLTTEHTWEHLDKNYLRNSWVGRLNFHNFTKKMCAYIELRDHRSINGNIISIKVADDES